MISFWNTLPRPIKILAPMEDITDAAFRRLILECARPDVFFCEFINTDGLCSVGHDKVVHRLVFLPEQRPIVAQLWGTKPEKFLRAAREIAALGFDGLDINMGCPMAKVVRHGACAALIENRTLAREIYLAAKEGAGSTPVSIKTRIGYRDLQTLSWAEFLLDLKPVALTFHGRIAKQLYRGKADWNEIGKIVKLRDEMKSDTLVIGNGDVQSSGEIQERHAQYGVDGVMIGRAILKDPFAFETQRSSPFPSLSVDQKLALLRRHITLFLETWGGTKDFAHMKKFFKTYTAGFRGASALRTRLMAAADANSVQRILDEWKPLEAVAEDL